MLEDSFKFNNTTVNTWEVVDADICQSDSLNQLLVCIVRVTGNVRGRVCPRRDIVVTVPLIKL